MVSEGLITLGVVGVVFLSIIGCFSLCCLCCAVPMWLVCSRLFSSDKKSPGADSVAANQQQPQQQYQMVDVSEYRGGYEGSAFNAQMPDITAEPIAEAYLVPPLATVHTDNSDVVWGEQTANSSTGLKSPKSEGFQDVWAAVLFLLNILLVVWFAVQAYLLAAQSQAAQKTAQSAQDSAASSTQDLTALNVVLVSSGVLAVIASLLGSLWLTFLMNHAERLIELVMWANLALLSVSAVGCLVAGQGWGALIFALLAGLSYWYYVSIRNRIPFASAVIRAACAALRANYLGLTGTAVGMQLLQVLWFLLWSAASYGVYQLMTPTADASSPQSSSEQQDKDQSPAASWALFGLLVSMYWGAQVIKGLVQTTVCGTVACWWFQPQRKAPVRGSLFRAVTTSFGSVCLGSLLVAVIQALREMLNMARTQAQRRRGRDRNVALECFIGLAEWLLGLVEAALAYFNTYAYCYVAAYGLDFVTSGKQVTALFARRGWSAIINDNLIWRTITMGMLALVLFAGLTGALLSQALLGTTYAVGMDASGLAAMGGMLGGLMGLAVGMVLINLLESAVAMVFVSFAEDPVALQTNHPAEFENLTAKWRLAYPETIEWVACTSAAANTYHYNAHQYSSSASGSFVPPVVQAVPVTQGGAVSYLPTSSGIKSPYTAPHSNNPPPVNPNYRAV